MQVQHPPCYKIVFSKWGEGDDNGLGREREGRYLNVYEKNVGEDRSGCA